MTLTKEERIEAYKEGWYEAFDEESSYPEEPSILDFPEEVIGGIAHAVVDTIFFVLTGESTEYGEEETEYETIKRKGYEDAIEHINNS